MPLNSGRILVNGSSFYCGNSTSNLCQLALKSDISSSGYVHPTTKQCSWSPDLSNYATKSDLDEIRDMIETSQGPTIVGSGSEPDAMNGGRPVYVSLSTCNYVVVTIIKPPPGYRDTATVYKGSSVTLYTNSIGNLFRQTFSLNSSGTRLTISSVSSDRDENISAFSWIAYR